MIEVIVALLSLAGAVILAYRRDTTPEKPDDLKKEGLSGRVEGKDLDEYDESDFMDGDEVERLMKEANADDSSTDEPLIIEEINLEEYDEEDMLDEDEIEQMIEEYNKES